jgi:hypothetical protein
VCQKEEGRKEGGGKRGRKER